MKVFPVQPSRNITYTPNTRNNLYYSQTNSDGDKFQLSKTHTIQLFEPENLDGIHCARCGVETITYKKLNAIETEMGTVQNAGDMAKVIRKNQKYLNKEFTFVSDLLSNHINPNVEPAAAIWQIYERCVNEYSNSLNKGLKEMEKLLKSVTVSDRDKEYIRDCLDSIQKTGTDYTNYYEHKYLLNNCQRNIDFKLKNYIFQKIFTHCSAVYSLRMNIFANNIFLLEPQSMKENFAKILYKSNLAFPTAINRKYDIETPGNKVVVCKKCLDSRKFLKYFYSPLDSMNIIKLNLLNYMRDLEDARKKGLIQISPRKIMNIMKFAEHNNENIVFNQTDIELFKFHQRHQMLELANLSDVPCPSCGVKMMSYSDSMEIEKELSQITKLPYFAVTMKKNIKNVPIKLHSLVNEYKKYVFENPTTSDSMVKTHMYKYVTKILQNNLYRLGRRIDYTIENNNIIPEDITKLRNLKNKINETACYDKEIHIINTLPLEEMLNNSPILDKNDNFGLRNEVIKSIIKIKRLQHIVFLSKKDSSTVRYWSEGFAKNILRSSRFTTDHFNARYNGGTEEKSNKIGLCKTCNTEKTNMEVDTWYKNFVKTDKNFFDYLSYVQKAVDEGKLEDYETYPAQIAQNAYVFTGGSLDLRKYFPLKK